MAEKIGVSARTAFFVRKRIKPQNMRRACTAAQLARTVIEGAP